MFSAFWGEVQYIPGAAEESDLVRIGDVLLGISGVCVIGMDPQLIHRVIASARSVTPGGLLVMHLCESTIDNSLVEEACHQITNAAAQLLQSRQLVEAIQHAVYTAVTSSSGYSVSAATPTTTYAASGSTQFAALPGSSFSSMHTGSVPADMVAGGAGDSGGLVLGDAGV
ncbi:hypothetical protein EON66_06430 [archaeon]|nr:MAG: hypothetical protein EON66_06430 [archaeon]